MSFNPIFILYLFFTGIGFASADDAWHLKKNSKGVQVYMRSLEHSAFKELKAVTQHKTSLNSIVALLNDWNAYPQWVYRCSESKTLKRISDSEVIHYQTINTPWPADPRDFVANVKISQDPDTKIVIQQSTCIPDYIPPVKGYVRISELKASWKLTPLSPGLVNIEYQLMVDPGGNIPATLENLAAVEGPYQTILNLKQWVIKPKYQKSDAAFIIEPEWAKTN